MDDGKGLEQWVVEFQAAGQAWVAAKLKADQLSEGQKNFLSALINKLEVQATEKMSEAKFERRARGSKEFIDYTNRMSLAVNDALSKRVRYDAMELWFKAKQSGLSFEKEVLRKGIFHMGQGG